MSDSCGGRVGGNFLAAATRAGNFTPLAFLSLPLISPGLVTSTVFKAAIFTMDGLLEPGDGTQGVVKISVLGS